ncbi:MAG TPA: hypothetical protein VM013_02005, partial [Dehalococcoidia bacterium]|nr:hypothetical protein [Dehalococcoidia bacterium]
MMNSNIRRGSLLGLSLMAALAVLLALSADWGGRVAGAEGPTLTLDMDTTNGSGPCNPVDNARAVNVGDTYQIAVCLSDSPKAPAAFNFDIFYDTSLVQSPNIDCLDSPCLDANPDANAGTTSWGQPLGTGWDCGSMGAVPPAGDMGGKAWMSCLTLLDPGLPVGPGVSSPLALVSFKQMEKGSVGFNLTNVALGDADAALIVDCYGESSACVGGTAATDGQLPAPSPTAESAAPNETVSPDAGPAATAAAATAIAQGTPVEALDQAATATSAAAATKTAASTPSGKATAKPGATTEDDGGSSGPNAGVIAGIVIVVVIVAGGAGWFAWRRMR